jgi:hypothetical protein
MSCPLILAESRVAGLTRPQGPESPPGVSRHGQLIGPRPPSIDPSSVRDHLTRFPPHAQGRLALGRLRRR